MECLRLLIDLGFALDNLVWVAAAKLGHPSCLNIAVSLGYTLEESLLEDAVLFGQLACVELLLQQGLPREPYLHSVFRTSLGQFECLQLMLDKGVAINPETLILAASRGDVDFVRWLHRRGVPLWQEARDASFKSSEWVRGCPWPQQIYRWATVEGQPEAARTIAVPWKSCQDVRSYGIRTCVLEDRWKALRYGAVFAAPVTRRVERVFAKKRERTHTVLLCFKAAVRLCTGPGPAKERHVWAGMAALPLCLVEELLILADLEIPESVVRRLPLTPPATAP